MSIVQGYVLEAVESHEASSLSYEDMLSVGKIVLHSAPEARGDDLNDAPFNCNGSISNGVSYQLNKGDYVIVIKGAL